MRIDELVWDEWNREDVGEGGNDQVIGGLADRLEALVRETLAVQWTPSPEPVLVREDRPSYGEQGSEEV